MIDYSVRNHKVAAQALRKIFFGNRMTKEMGLQTFRETDTDDADVQQCSTVGKQRPEKRDRRWLKDGCIGQQGMMTKRCLDRRRLVELVSEISL